MRKIRRLFLGLKPDYAFSCVYFLEKIGTMEQKITEEAVLHLKVLPKGTDKLYPTDIFQQTSFWGRVKERLGWMPEAFDLAIPGERADILVMRRGLGPESEIAYIPFGPELLPDGDSRGCFLEEVSEELKDRLPEECILIRYELPWESPYAHDSSRFDGEGHWIGAPEPNARELRMNFGTVMHNLRKAPTDIMPADTVIIDLSPSLDVLFERMKPKTRYNIRVAERSGIVVSRGELGELPLWYDLYCETCLRHGLAAQGYEHFESLYLTLSDWSLSPAVPMLLLASHEGKPVAGIIIVLSHTRATYLYGASAWEERRLMAPYALQWEAIRTAKESGCTDYDLYGISPGPDPVHPLYGLYRFKTGFGGRIVHRQGCWDYPLKPVSYAQFRAQELNDRGYHNL
jgi:lipid II:glycine glycyltransferase (peptidoglycan interpeptide bridge formation enzyme)